ncbi:unnamed protein product [Rangifer tarandus platyrhynchus]|uniref:Uncharacterized protein n=2 Tax=Rangifer tarandus platyrhynchus TaxID=3082113 RepID=A0ACB0E6L7_RANTA|nr:unnamed protein product [Rangifer tarandus platyrhynchus]CAI9696132.1 unnamed protein product [Rangifer tarandus platyrhynchus]
MRCRLADMAAGLERQMVKGALEAESMVLGSRGGERSAHFPEWHRRDPHTSTQGHLGHISARQPTRAAFLFPPQTLLELACASPRLPGVPSAERNVPAQRSWKHPELAEQAGRGQLSRTSAPKPLGAADSLEQGAGLGARAPPVLHSPLHP